jgi:hypothetical protein
LCEAKENSWVCVVTAEDERNYVPSRPKPTVRTVLMIGGPGLNAREYTPVDPARARRSGDVQSEADKERSQNEKDFVKPNKVNVNFTLGQSFLEEGPVVPEALEKGENRVWGYNFGMRDSPTARETASEPGFERRSKAEVEPEGRGGLWKQDKKKIASKRAEKKKGKTEEKQNKNKTKTSQTHPNESRPLLAFQQTESANNASMDPKEKCEKEPAETSANDSDEVMLITVKKGRECQVRYLSAAVESKDAAEYTSAMKETFTIDATPGEVLQRKSKRKESMFREYRSRERNERELEPYVFSDVTPETHGEKRKAAPMSLEESFGKWEIYLS